MSTLIEQTEQQQQQQQPLLSNQPQYHLHKHETITPPSSSNGRQSPSQNQRLISLDVFRGLTVALMILVDDAGGAFPSIDHSPWFGVTIADFVMPFFLFGVGVSVGLVFKNVSSKCIATKKVVLRTIKLFVLGVLLQGGYFHGWNNLTYGVDVTKMRWMGVLQTQSFRISIGYLFAAMSEIWLVNNIMVDSPVAFVKKYHVQCWEFEALSANLLSHGSEPVTVNCGVRGSLEPPCNAVGFVDRYLLGEYHLYQRPVYRRTKECSINSPDYGPLPPNSPGWCLAPFDPEGILSSLMASVTCFLGLHFGHVLVHVKEYKQRVLFLSIFSSLLLIAGYAIKFLGIPFSKPLYTLSYMFITAGAPGLTLTIIFYLVDVKSFRKPVMILQWMGMNALVIYALAACHLFPAALQGFYWHSPKNNLVNGTESVLQAVLHSDRWGTMTFVLLDILFWGLVAGFLHMKGIYVKM